MTQKHNVFIRFNTEYPTKGRKWRLLNEDFEEFNQIDEFVSLDCPIESSTDVMPNGETKHHVKLTYSKVVVINHIANFVK